MGGRINGQSQGVSDEKRRRCRTPSLWLGWAGCCAIRWQAVVAQEGPLYHAWLLVLPDISQRIPGAIAATRIMRRALVDDRGQTGGHR